MKVEGRGLTKLDASTYVARSTPLVSADIPRLIKPGAVMAIAYNDTGTVDPYAFNSATPISGANAPVNTVAKW